MREERLLSVGIDIGTSTTQCAFSALTLQNTASSFSIPRIQITEKTVLYRAPLRLTPLSSPDTIDTEALKAIVLKEYQAAGISPGDIRLGAVIITGETARKQNARAVLEALGLAGNLQTAQLMERILGRDAKGALLQLDQLYQGGKDVGAVLGELSTLVRDLLLRRTAREGGAALLSGGYDEATLDRLGRDVPAARMIDLAAALQKTTADLYYSTNRRMDAELCLLRLCDETLSGDLTALAARMDRLEEEVRRDQILRSAVTAQIGQDPPARKPAPVPEAAPVPEDTPPWEGPAEEPMPAAGGAGRADL